MAIRNRISTSIVLSCSLIWLTVASSLGTQIGAGAAAMGATPDGTGGRTNIDQSWAYLPAGTYDVNEFNFWGVSTSGTVQPFLSSQTATGPQQYTPVWVGGAGGGVIGLNTSPFAPGTQQFTLAQPTRIYSGFGMTENAVGFNGGGATDHNGPPALIPVVGNQLPVFSNNNLGRTYSSGLRVTDANPLNGGAIGPGSGISNAINQDTPGEDRLNVERLFTTLSAGTYRVSDWSLNVLDHAQGGSITPMLLTGSGGNYSTLWLGSSFDPSSNGDQMVGESGTFTLPSTGEVFAGFYTQGGGSGIIALDAANAGNFGLTDHANSFTAPSGLGESVTGFSNPGLSRTYAFEINVQAIPEPSAFSLLIFGSFALFARRRF
ncbi:MAG: hypothetical protein ACI9TH_002373 [Kiritimatiellia bacterium]|jgi:hypothetical protein